MDKKIVLVSNKLIRDPDNQEIINFLNKTYKCKRCDLVITN